jgi:hypothetical protein
MRLIFGVVNVAYSDGKKATTTGKVAKLLEDEYHVMRTFYELHEKEIGEQVANKLAGMLDNALRGKKPSPNVSMDRTASAFRDYLSGGEWEQSSGQVIAAAQNGVSHRFKNKNNVPSKGKVRGSRAAFVDTGLYAASFRAWLKT